MRAGAVLVVLVFVAIGFWLCWPLFFPVDDRSMWSQLLQADVEIMQGHLDKALVILENSPKNLTAQQWLSVEKRLKEIGRKTNAWVRISSLSNKALDQYPGNTALAAFHVWTLLKADRPSEAMTIGKEKLGSTSFSSLTTQAIIESTILTQSKDQNGWITLKNQLANPYTVSLELLQKLVSLDSGIFLKRNVLLSFLAQGKTEQAVAFLENFTSSEKASSPFDQLQALIALDLGNWRQALIFLNSLTSHHSQEFLKQDSRWDFFATLLAEAYLHLGKIKEAKIIYDQLLQNQPASLTTILNRSMIALGEKNPTLVLKLLDRQNFKNQNDELSRSLRLQSKLLRWEAIFAQDPDTVKKELNQILQDVKETNETEFFLDVTLLKAKLFPQTLSLSQLWSLFHRHRNYAPLAERLTWQLILAEDYTQALRVLSMFEEKNQEPSWWTWYYRGLVACLQSDFSLATQAFNHLASSQRDYSLFYNWALALVAQSQLSQQEPHNLLEQAMEKIMLCFENFPTTEDLLQVQRSQALTLKGQLGITLMSLHKTNQKSIQQILTDLTQAVQLNPENLKAAFLLRQITFSNMPKELTTIFRQPESLP